MVPGTGVYRRRHFRTGTPHPSEGEKGKGEKAEPRTGEGTPQTNHKGGGSTGENHDNQSRGSLCKRV